VLSGPNRKKSSLHQRADGCPGALFIVGENDMERNHRGKTQGRAAWRAGLIGIVGGVLLCGLWPPPAGAQAPKEPPGEKPPCADTETGKSPFSEDRPRTTHHVLQTVKGARAYTATAGALEVSVDEEKGPACGIFFIGYEVQEQGGPKTRPVTFVFNGGPGAASAYLHLGALGPRRVVFASNGAVPGPPSPLAENRHCWLEFTDLVFVDPVGTGYSRCKNGSGDGEKSAAQKPWGVQEDVNILAKFVRLYLTRNGRWLSPKFLVGESYGGFRAAALSHLLQSDYGIAVNGLVLVSPALEFGVLPGQIPGLLPWVASLPSFAATARHHGKARSHEQPSGQEGLREALTHVEQFAVQELLPALAQGSAVPAVIDRLARFTGLDRELVRRNRCRIRPALFSKELLRDRERLVSVYDGSRTSIDPDPAFPLPSGQDPLLLRINAQLAGAFNHYVRDQLQFETDRAYELLNKEVFRSWNWSSGIASSQGFVGAAQELKRCMSVDIHLKVLIAHGVYDLVTPYFGSVLVTRQMSLDPAIADNLSMRVYGGGHMFYTHDSARIRFFEDARRFYSRCE